MIGYNFLQQTPSLAAYGSSASQQIHHILQNSKLHYLSHNLSLFQAKSVLFTVKS